MPTVRTQLLSANAVVRAKATSIGGKSCPAGQSECGELPPIPAGDGCDASLQWWFDRLDAPPEKPSGPVVRRKPMVPAACGPILTMPSAARR